MSWGRCLLDVVRSCPEKPVTMVVDRSARFCHYATENSSRVRHCAHEENKKRVGQDEYRDNRSDRDGGWSFREEKKTAGPVTREAP